jgi:hypothetical protein
MDEFAIFVNEYVRMSSFGVRDLFTAFGKKKIGITSYHVFFLFLKTKI